jgi:hypothetical protein
MCEQLVQRGLGPFDLGGQNRLFSDECIEQQVNIGHRRRHAIEPSEGEHGSI